MKKKKFFWLNLIIISFICSLLLNGFNFSFNKGIGQPVFAQNNSQGFVQQGTKTIINQREINLPWIEWREGNQTYIGISDIALQNTLGVELLNSNNPNEQPIQWFNSYHNLPARFVNPYRYLDTRKLLENTDIVIERQEDTLIINTPNSRVNRVYDINQSQQKRVVIELERPTFFRVSQARDEGVIIIEGQPTFGVSGESDDSSINPYNNTGALEDEGDRVRGAQNPVSGALFRVETNNNATLVHINIPAGHNLKVNSSAPNILFAELSPTAKVQKNISWSNDLSWQDTYVRLSNGETFFVSMLKANLQRSELSLRPIVTNNSTMIGTAPLRTMAQGQGAIAAINGGFFNRNNQLPLGAIRNNQNWQSAPILNRGVLAWNDAGNFQISRLRLQETIINSTGDRLVSDYINSGYVQTGVSRYTRSWGNSYTSLSNNETIIVVEGDRIRDKVNIAQAGANPITIPANGYLIVVRNSPQLVSNFNQGQQLQITSSTTPPTMANFPHMLGAGPVLINNRQIVLNGEAEGFTNAFNQQRASRSGVAIDNQGNIMFVAAHQRIGGPGPSLQEFAQILLQLGAKDALNLDGGSSTQIYLGGEIIDRSPVTAARVHNGLGLFYRPRN
ncbi:phosphodiester glycosidase family protein [Cyanobacterium sp. IPPAS B-1200]|uniref:phosphodiester glycosidase family protein n=1 Tax=Cyanobacterium sp. IPPAS B-1200 TaxID=1562720 RepID=UPI000B270320|nr:phosphodiester glycosidase family protein [Cyanobacterium sp. IPPAS B-1200]